MAACGVSFSRGMLNVCGSRVPASSEILGVVGPPRISGPAVSFPGRVHVGGRVFARQGVESNAGVPVKEEIRVTDARLLPRVGGAVASSRSSDFDIFQGRGWSEASCDEGALLNDNCLADLRAREIFLKTGEITEKNMDRLVEALVDEEGQSAENYRCRAVMFGKIAEFFGQGKAYMAEKDESSSSAVKAARSVQVLVDIILAEEGRSAMDYNLRAQVFAKSAAAFPFNAEVRSG